MTSKCLSLRPGITDEHHHIQLEILKVIKRIDKKRSVSGNEGRKGGKEGGKVGESR
jgi:hypothetical protein